jgi:steroid delta-isomerase
MDRQERVRATVVEHFRLWKQQDRDRWLALFHPDVVIEDPIGQPAMHGLEGAAAVYDRAQGWTVTPVEMHIAGDEAAMVVTNAGEMNGEFTVVNTIEIWTVDDEGLVTGLRVFVTVPGA